MKRRMIVCITLAAILLVVGGHIGLSVVCHNGTDGHTMTLNAGDVLVIRFETEKGTLHLEIQAPDGNVLYSGNGQNAKDFTVNIAESGSYTMTVKAQSATGFIHIQTENQ